MDLVLIIFLRSSHAPYQEAVWVQTVPPQFETVGLKLRLRQPQAAGVPSSALEQAGKARNYGTAAARLAGTRRASRLPQRTDIRTFPVLLMIKILHGLIYPNSRNHGSTVCICNLLRPLIKILFLMVPSGYIPIKKEFLRRRQILGDAEFNQPPSIGPAGWMPHQRPPGLRIPQNNRGPKKRAQVTGLVC